MQVCCHFVSLPFLCYDILRHITKTVHNNSSGWCEGIKILLVVYHHQKKSIYEEFLMHQLHFENKTGSDMQLPTPGRQFSGGEQSSRQFNKRVCAGLANFQAPLWKFWFYRKAKRKTKSWDTEEENNCLCMAAHSETIPLLGRSNSSVQLFAVLSQWTVAWERAFQSPSQICCGGLRLHSANNVHAPDLPDVRRGYHSPRLFLTPPARDIPWNSSCPNSYLKFLFLLLNWILKELSLKNIWKWQFRDILLFENLKELLKNTKIQSETPKE